MNMGLQDLIEKCHNTGYKKLNLGKKPRYGMLKKVKRRFKGFRLMTTRKLKWRSFWIAMMPLRRTLGICYDMLNRLKLDGAYPAIVFSSQWGLPVLAHPTSKCRNPHVSIYRKPTVNHVVFA